MRPDQRIVTRLPLTALWDAHGEISLERKREAGREEVANLLRHGTVSFVIAKCGHPTRWIPAEEVHRFWKADVQPHLIEPHAAENGFRPEDFPGEYCYIGSVWEGQGQPTVVLLEVYH